MLNGKQLVDQAGKLKIKHSAIGEKLVKPPSDIAEVQRLLEAKGSFKEFASLERIHRVESRSIGHYENQKVRIEKLSGKTHRLLGYKINNVHYLEPHEALYLMETNALIVYFDGIVVSIEQGYHLFLDTPKGLSTENYFAFTHLMRSGYYVRRHKQVQRISTDKLDGKEKILTNLKQNLNCINRKDALKYEQCEKVQQEFLQIREDCLHGKSIASKEMPTEAKKQRLDPLPDTVPMDRYFPGDNPSGSFSHLFQSLRVIGEYSNESVSNISFDFDIYPAESKNCPKKLAERPKYYAKVVKYTDKMDNATIQALVKKCLGTEVLILIVFENLSIASYVLYYYLP